MKIGPIIFKYRQIINMDKYTQSLQYIDRIHPG